MCALDHLTKARVLPTVVLPGRLRAIQRSEARNCKPETEGAHKTQMNWLVMLSTGRMRHSTRCLDGETGLLVDEQRYRRDGRCIAKLR